MTIPGRPLSRPRMMLRAARSRRLKSSGPKSLFLMSAQSVASSCSAI